MTLAESENRIRVQYTSKAKLLRPGRARITVTLTKPRVYNVVVMRTKAGMTRGYSLDLPVYRNDVLNALVQTGGLPGKDSKNEIYILKAEVLDRRRRDEFVREWFTAASSVDAGVVKIPRPIGLCGELPV